MKFAAFQNFLQTVIYVVRIVKDDVRYEAETEALALYKS